MLGFLERAFRQEVHRRRCRDQDKRERRVNECHRDGCNVNENGDKIFARHLLVQSLKLGFAMLPRDRRAQQKKRNRARDRDRGVKCDWERQCVIVTEIDRDPRYERDPKKQIDVCPQNDGIDPADHVNKMMMVHPVDGDDDEAKYISKKGWPHSNERRWCRVVGRLQLQNHDGDENGYDTIAESFDPVGFHAGATLLEKLMVDS